MGNYFRFGNVNSADYGVWISGSGTFNKPARRVEKISVPGRNGDLTIDEGVFENVSVTYPAFISRGFENRYHDFIAAMMSQTGYQKLQDTYDSDHFRMGLFAEEQEPEVGTLNRTGKFELTFNCMPQRFLVEGDRWMDIGLGPYWGLHLNNPTGYTAVPVFRTVGAGLFDVTTNNNRLSGLAWGVTVSNPSSGSLPAYIDIDSDIEECYTLLDAGQWNERYQYWNNVVTISAALGSPWAFPILYKGEESIISVSGNFTALQVKPRWWEL